MTRGRILGLLAVVLIFGIGVTLLRGAPRFASVGSDFTESEGTAAPMNPSEPSRASPSQTPGASSANGVRDSEPRLTAEDQRKASVLEQILLKRNDNDPRIDTELKDLSPSLKRVLASRYRSWKPEKFNERGTIVFLVGREIREPADVDFLKSVLMEKPCLNISDCSKVPEAHSGEDDHREMVNETTIRYPQLMALSALKEKYELLKKNPEGKEELMRQIRSALEEATRSPDPRMVEEAEAILRADSARE